jgi:primosomal protein N' (replication factor Y) (superfamily II helicase)
MRPLNVAVPVPGLGPLTYNLGNAQAMPPVGARVLVPLGNRIVTGVVCPFRLKADATRQSAAEAARENTAEAVRPNTAEGTPPSAPGFRLRPSPRLPPSPRLRRTAVALAEAGQAEESDIKDVIDVLDRESFLPPDVVDLAGWVAEYYACGIGAAVAAAMPPGAWVESERRARITERGEARLLTERGLRRDLLTALTGGRLEAVSTLAKRSSSVHAILMALEEDGLVTLTQPLKGSADASRTIRVALITAQGTDVTNGPAEVRLGPRQREALALLRGTPDGVSMSDLAERGIPRASVAGLVRLGLASIERRRIERDPFENARTPLSLVDSLVLTTEQESALAQLRELSSTGRYQAALLHGVTGSGKTEIYLRLAREIRQSGRSVLLMVPEIALTPAASAIFRRAFGARVAIQHSGLSDGERYDQWQRIRRGDVDVVVGTRSAVFTPLTNLGLIVVDEEHDGSYKQEEIPRYHGRDVAVVRARNANALVVLGSATPALESYHNAEHGRYTLVTLARRVLDRPMADVRIVDMRSEYAAEGPDLVLSARLREALAARLERGEQSIVLLNRRGFATVVFCRECAETLECPNCSVSLTVHKRIGRARCHYCNYSMPLPKTCRRCAGPFLEQLGFGTERVESEISSLLPKARVARVDRDTIRRRGAIDALFTRFAAGELDVLVGTQMIAKGHDFPKVTLVGVISADVGLGLADFRAAERTFQLLTQVAGRSGRGTLPGEAIIQTLYPNHYSIQHACGQDYAAFYRDELTYRRAMRYPPAVALINVVVKARTRQRAMDDAGEIVKALRASTREDPGDPDGTRPKGAFRVLGPAPAPLSRLKGEHRAQLFIKGTHRNAMRTALMAVLASRPELKRRTIVDVDPMSVL